ncbi:unnamed protein product [Meganyctiphanes norvegica]|uniref:Uncharacterized protein n=1 Tax=Meganyctiphanes norvegica TaxID=48144 RepID=A0AAV2R1I8_MEGNR
MISYFSHLYIFSKGSNELIFKYTTLLLMKLKEWARSYFKALVKSFKNQPQHKPVSFLVWSADHHKMYVPYCILSHIGSRKFVSDSKTGQCLNTKNNLLV